MISLDIEFKKSEVNEDTIATFKLNAEQEHLDRQIKSLFQEMNVQYKEEWRSKYSDYVVGDHEPFCKEGFNKIYRTISDDKLSFVISLLQKYIRNVNQLEKNLSLNYKGTKNSKAKKARLKK